MFSSEVGIAGLGDCSPVHMESSRKDDKGKSLSELTFNLDADRRSAVRPGKRSRAELSLEA